MTCLSCRAVAPLTQRQTSARVGLDAPYCVRGSSPESWGRTLTTWVHQRPRQAGAIAHSLASRLGGCASDRSQTSPAPARARIVHSEKQDTVVARSPRGDPRTTVCFTVVPPPRERGSFKKKHHPAAVARAPLRSPRSRRCFIPVRAPGCARPLQEGNNGHRPWYSRGGGDARQLSPIRSLVLSCPNTSLGPSRPPFTSEAPARAGALLQGRVHIFAPRAGRPRR